jgi:hypothetical protein
VQKETRRPCSQKQERHVGYFDVHARHAIDFAETLRFQTYFEPTDIILGGDFIDCGLASKWNDKFFKHLGWNTISKLLQKEFDAARLLAQRIRAASPRATMWFTPGNHENWLFLAKFHYPDIVAIPALPKEFNRPNFKTDFEVMGQRALGSIIEDILDAKALKMTVLPYKQLLTLGKITYMHGDQFSSPKATARLFPTRNIVYGHHHTHYVETLNDNGLGGTAVQHVGVPCMTHMGPGYLQSGSTRWLNGFWTARVMPGGLFDGNVVKVLGGKHIVY